MIFFPVCESSAGMCIELRVSANHTLVAPRRTTLTSVLPQGCSASCSIPNQGLVPLQLYPIFARAPGLVAPAMLFFAPQEHS